MAEIKISELEPTTDLEGLYTIGSDKNNLSKKVSLQFLREAADYAIEQGDYAKQEGSTIESRITDFKAETDAKLTELESEVKASVEVQNNEINLFKEAVTDQINNYKPIEIYGNVTNAPDEEDITSEDGLLKLANRSAINGMGYVILRKDKTFAEQVTQPNTIYEILYDFDLNSQGVTMKQGCILSFNGGSISNGVLTFNGTKVRHPRFSNCQFNGWLDEAFIDVCDYGVIPNDVNFDCSIVVNNLIKLKAQSKTQERTLYFKSGVYYIKSSIILWNYFNTAITLKGDGNWTNICQLTDNIPIIKHYEMNHIADIMLSYNNQQPVSNTNATAIAVQRAIYSNFTNITIRKAQKGFGYIRLSEQNNGDGPYEDYQDQTYVNVAARDIKIYACSGYALDFRKEMAQGDSGSVFDNIYISCQDWLSDTNVTSEGAVYLHNTHIIFHQLNIEGQRYSKPLIYSSGVGIFKGDVIHIEAINPLPRIVHLADQSVFNVNVIRVTNCQIHSAYSILFYSETPSPFIINCVTFADDCISDQPWFLVGGATSGGVMVINALRRAPGCIAQSLNRTPDLIQLIVNNQTIMSVEEYQSVVEVARKNSLVIDDSLNTATATHGKILYKDNNNILKFLNGFVAYHNGRLIRTEGSSSERPDLSSASNNINIGFVFFDKTIKKPIWWTGAKWVDATGADI